MVMLAEINDSANIKPRVALILDLCGCAVEDLPAQQQLFPAENALAQTQLDQLLAFVRLYKALGGGWELPNPEPAHGN